MKALSVVVPGFNAAPGAYRGTTPPQLELAWHEFRPHDGGLLHLIDGRERAWVPREGLKDYVACWPAAADVAAGILGVVKTTAKGARR